TCRLVHLSLHAALPISGSTPCSSTEFFAPIHDCVHTEHLSIPVGAGHLHVERVGRGGLPIVLLHGFGTCAFLWRNVAPRLANAGYTALSIDLLGHGESDWADATALRIGAQAEYVDRALTALRIPGAIVVGQDVGCIVALMLAARRPQQVKR